MMSNLTNNRFGRTRTDGSAEPGPFRAGWYYWILLCLSLLLPAAAQAQQPVLPAVPTSCSYTSAPANIVLTALNVPSGGFSTLYLLVDMVTGAIVQTNPTTPTFNGVGAGLYYAVAAHYTGSLNNATSGKLISDVYDDNACLTYGPTTAIKVCQMAGICDFVSAPASVTFSAINVPGGVTTTYVLVDEATNLIVETSSSTSFGSVAVGDYAITAVHYSGTLAGLSVGNSLYTVTTNEVNCFGVSNTVRVRVCNATIAITGPINGGTVASTNPPISGTATPGISVTVTGGPGSAGGPCVTITDGNGNWTCSGLTFPNGPASVTATDGVSKVVSNFTVAQPPVVAITSPNTVTVATKNPTITGTATPFASVLVTTADGQLGPTVADVAGNWSCTSLTFTNGPQSVTAIATNAGGTSVPAIASFTVAQPPSVTINSPAPGEVVASLNPPISGTATPGTSVTVTGGPGTTGGPCIVTASVSGTYTCTSLTFVNGPASVMAQTSDNGILSSPVGSSFTVAVPPTVAILSPADNGTATTTPTISGTATPNAVVTVTGGPGSTGGPVSVTADASGVYSTTAIIFPAAPTSVTAVATNASGTSSPAVSNFTAEGPTTVVIVRPRVFLAGAYVTSTGLMRDDLRTKSLLPLGDPYSTTSLSTSFTHTAGSAGTSIASSVLSVTGNNAIVDWVFVQLHDPTSASTVVMTRAGLVQRDGDIVDLDGTSPLSFTANPGSFYLSVRHRNHLGVMTLNTVALSNTVVTVDFTDPATATYGTYAQRVISPTTPNSVTATALWAGNANSNKNVIYQGSGNDLGMILSQIYMASSNSSQDKTFILSQYLTGDLNLDGNVIYQGSGNELGIVLGTVLLLPDNITSTKIYIVSEQLP